GQATCSRPLGLPEACLDGTAGPPTWNRSERSAPGQVEPMPGRSGRCTRLTPPLPTRPDPIPWVNPTPDRAAGGNLQVPFSAGPSVVVQDRAEGAVLGEQRVAAEPEQVEVERLVGLLLAVTLDFDRDGLGRLAGGERQRAGLGDVVVV